MKGFSLFLIVGGLFGQWDNLSARIMGLGSVFAYLVPDTLTDMLINPSNVPKASMLIAKPYPFPQAGAFYRGTGVWVRPERYGRFSSEKHDTVEDYYGKVIRHTLSDTTGLAGSILAIFRLDDWGVSANLTASLQKSASLEECFDSTGEMTSAHESLNRDTTFALTALFGWKRGNWEATGGLYWTGYTIIKKEAWPHKDSSVASTWDEDIYSGILRVRYLGGGHGNLYAEIRVGPRYYAESTPDEVIERGFRNWKWRLRFGYLKVVDLAKTRLFLGVINADEWGSGEKKNLREWRFYFPVGLEKDLSREEAVVFLRGGYQPYFLVQREIWKSQDGSWHRDWRLEVRHGVSFGLSILWEGNRFEFYNTNNLMSIGDWRVEFWKTF